MHSKLAAAALLAASLWGTSASAAARPELQGDWQGRVSEAMPFPLVLHVHDEVRLDSPERGVFGLLGEARQEAGHVNIVFANGAAFEGDLTGDRLTGAYLRGPASLPLIFDRKPAGTAAPAGPEPAGLR